MKVHSIPLEADVRVPLTPQKADVSLLDSLPGWCEGPFGSGIIPSSPAPPWRNWGASFPLQAVKEGLFLVQTLGFFLSFPDFDECTVYGTCSQTCTNTEGSYTCSCVEGYLLQPDNRSCKAKNGERGSVVLQGRPRHCPGLPILRLQPY